MKKNLVMAWMAIVVLAGMAIGQGWNTVVKNTTGGFPATVKTTISASAATLFLTATTRRADSSCRNWGSYEIFIGSNAAGATLGDIGFPVKADETYHIGSNSANWYGISPDGASEFRCIEGKI